MDKVTEIKGDVALYWGALFLETYKNTWKERGTTWVFREQGMKGGWGWKDWLRADQIKLCALQCSWIDSDRKRLHLKDRNNDLIHISKGCNRYYMENKLQKWKQVQSGHQSPSAIHVSALRECLYQADKLSSY